jgi:hypothetical protein
VVQYLSRYTHKTAIYNNRLDSMDEETVTFRYRDYKAESKVKTMKLDAMEFMRRFMLHVLPSGFQRIRYYGFLSNCNRKTKLRKCMRLTRTAIKPREKLTAKELIMKVTGVDISVCSSCGGNWHQVLTIHPGQWIMGLKLHTSFYRCLFWGGGSCVFSEVKSIQFSRR